jgi:septum formation topological specificity factor MinE
VQQNFGICEERRENEQSNAVEQLKQNIIEYSNMHTDQEEELKKSQDIRKDYMNITSAEVDPDTADSTNNKDDVYTSTLSNSVAPLQEQPQRQDFKKEEEANPYHEGLLSSPDPFLAQTTDYLNNIREEYYEYQCSKCHYKEAVWKNTTKPTFCARCKTLSTEE